jgi:hypothetical protein
MGGGCEAGGGGTQKRKATRPLTRVAGVHLHTGAEKARKSGCWRTVLCLTELMARASAGSIVCTRQTVYEPPTSSGATLLTQHSASRASANTDLPPLVHDLPMLAAVCALAANNAWSTPQSAVAEVPPSGPTGCICSCWCVTHNTKRHTSIQGLSKQPRSRTLHGVPSPKPSMLYTQRTRAAPCSTRSSSMI